jgi:ferric-dicitrate binding protein FerR (iron transport regulator)
MDEQRLFELIDALLESRISDAERDELRQILRASPAAQELYSELIELDGMLRDTVQDPLGHDLALLSSELAERKANQSGDETASAATASWESLGKHFAARTTTEPRRSLSSWLAAALLITLVGLIGWGMADWRQHARPAGSPPQRPAVATLRQLTGAAWRTPANASETKIAVGATFTFGDALRVGESSLADVTLADGSRLELGAGAELRFPATADGPRGELFLNRGGVEVTAVPQSPDRPLVITTVAARLTVMGTQFRLYAREEDSRVELVEGRVRFERRLDGNKVEVAAGQYAIAASRGSPGEPLVVRQLEDSWRLSHSIDRAGERVAFSPDGVWLATASHTQVAVWDVATGQPCYQQPAAARYDALACASDNSGIVALSHQGSVLRWRFAEGVATTADLTAVAGKMRHGALASDGQWIAQATGVENGHLAIWRGDRQGGWLPLPALPMKAMSVAVATPAGGGPLIVACDEQGAVVRWEAATGRELARYRLDSPLHLLDLSADGRWLGGYGNGVGLLLLDMATGVVHEPWPAASIKVNDVRFTADGGLLYAAMADGVVRAWATANAQPRIALATGDASLRSIALSSDGRWLAAAGDRDRVTLWRAEPTAGKTPTRP